MSLINCSECGKPVSDKAAACPHCGNPINDQETKPDTVVTIQKTAKEWKTRQVSAFITVVLGLLFMIAGQYFSVPFIFQLGIIVAVIGFLYLIFTKIGAWWNHE